MLLYIAVVLCVVIGQLYADKCDYHTMHVEPTVQIITVCGIRWHQWLA